MAIYFTPLIFNCIFQVIKKHFKISEISIFGKKINYDKLYLIIFFSILFFISAFRPYTVGTDTSHYIGFYDSYLEAGNSYLINLDIEIGYKILIYLSSFFSNSRFLLIITSLIICIGYYLFINKNSNDVYFSSFLFVTLYFFCLSLNIQRQSISMLFIAESIIRLSNNDYKFYSIFVLLASLFHITCLITLILFPIHILLKQKKLDNILDSILIAIFSFSVFFIDLLIQLVIIIFPKYSYYLNHSFYSEKMTTNEFVYYLLLFLLLMLSLIKILIYFNNKFKVSKKIVNLLDISTIVILFSCLIFCINNNRIIGLICFIVIILHNYLSGNKDLIYYSIVLSLFVVFLQAKMAIFDRFIWFFSIMLIIEIPNLCMKRKEIKILFYLGSLMYFLRLLLINSCQVVPYFINNIF